MRSAIFLTSRRDLFKITETRGLSHSFNAVGKSYTLKSQSSYSLRLIILKLLAWKEVIIDE
jgi:hypothetical protein